MYKTFTLNNKLEVVYAPLAGTKTVTVLAMVATGSKFENKTNSGLSHFLEHMFFKGTKRRPNTLAISSELDRVGGEYNAFTGKEYTGYYVKAEKQQLGLALDVLSDILLNSKFDSQEIRREKGVIIEELNMYLDNPLVYIEDLFETCLYGDTPAGRDTIGTKKTITGFTRTALLDYIRRQYSADKIIICLAGNLRPDSLDLCRRYFGKFPQRKYQEKTKVKETQTAPAIKAHYKKTDQAHLSLGVRTFPYFHPSELIVKLIAILLGGTMSSRLFIELRERHGLAYYVRSHEEAYTDSGYLTTQAGVPIDRLNEAIAIILAEYKKMVLEPVKAEELDRIKQCLIGRGALQLEASENLANWYARQIILLKEQGKQEAAFTPEKFYAAIKKITAQDMQKVARQIFVRRGLNLAVIGPYGGKEIKQFERLLKL